MKTHISIRAIISLVMGLMVYAAQSASAQHIHLNAGAYGTNQNDQLYFVNGNLYSTGSGFFMNLTYTNTETYAGYFVTTGLTITALPQTIPNGGPAANAPALGSFVVVQLTSVSGPAGGVFSFWEDDATSPTFSLTSGSTGGTDQWDLSDETIGAGAPGADPFGHLHGRAYTATLPGVYTVGFTLYDVSTNGEGSGPIHTPGETFSMNFVAVPEPSTLMLTALGVATALWKLRTVRAKNA